MPREVVDVADERGQRRAQLVRGVGEEAALGVARPLERGQHPVQRRGETADLVVRSSGSGSRRRGSPVRSISAAAPGEAPERRERAAHQQRERGRRGRGRDERGHEHERDGRSRASTSTSLRRRRDGDGAAGGRAARVGERRHVHPQVVAAELGARVPASAGRDHLAQERLHREHPAAERERAGDDPAAAVDDLDARSAARRARRRARPATTSSAGADALSCATSTARCPQRPVERPVQMTSDEQVDADRRRPRARAGSRATPRGSSERRASAGSSLEHEADAANRLDQRRLAELAAEIRDVAIDDVQARRGRPRPTPVRAPARG